MSDVPQMGPGGWPGFDPAQLMRMLQSDGPVNWEVARQVAAWIARSDEGASLLGTLPVPGGAPVQPPVDPPIDTATTTAFDGIARAAQAAVAETTGLGEINQVPVRVVGRGAWAEHTLTGLQPVLQALAETMQAPLTSALEDDEGPGTDPFAMLLPMLAPILLGVQSGSMVGFLAQHALGQYDLPLPIADPPQLAFVAENIDAFGEEWSLPADELRYALALRESVHAAQRSVGWVRDRLVRASTEYVRAYELRIEVLEEQFGDLDPSQLGELGGAGPFGDPNALLGAMRSDKQEPLLEELQRFVSVLEGYADVVVDDLGRRMTSNFGQIDEAIRRHRITRGQAAAFVDRLLGLELDREHYEQGVAFCRGVIERAGPDGLHRLWARESMVPTRNELDAPGLWLARIEFD
ncbi:MAG TPA: zinc-dependent metalloprotease [Acidimicrobiia bacterium]|nr:zinc-dependent metalloprotease [Acidimicrobiia bacterium]